MNAQVFDKVFSMSAFEGLRLLRYYKERHADLDSTELVDLILAVDPNASACDMEAAIILHAEIPYDTDHNQALPFYRNCIKLLVLMHRPTWLRIVTYGRSKLVDKLTRDAGQCFRAAGLMDTPPDNEVVQWWDDLSSEVRLAADRERMIRARTAEKLSYQHEVKRLEELNLLESPEWTGLDDNTAGYDVKSFDIVFDGNASSVINRLIEVKSTIASPLRFRLTRHEWETALRFGDSYFFHVWDMSKAPPRLFELSVRQVANCIPQDSKPGRWENVEVPVSISA